MGAAPDRFSRLRFSQYAQDLSKAIYGLSEEMKFSITEPVFFLGQQRKPGDVIEASVGPYKYERAQNGRMEPVAQFVELPHEIQPGANPTSAPPLATSVTQPTPLPTVSPVTVAAQTPTTETKSMSITGLQSGAFKAMLDDMRKEIADAQTSGLADVKASVVEAKTQITTAVSGVKAKVKSEVADALQEFAQFTNGAPE